MKNVVILLALLCLSTKHFAQTKPVLKDGLYLVAGIVSDSTRTETKNKQKVLVHFNKQFSENAPENSSALIVYTDNFVPLELNKEPELLKQNDAQKTIQLSFTKLASEKLAAFTSHNIMKEATLIVNGEALTLHKIRAAITSGKMEISRCGDNACEKIYVELMKDVKR